jgi:hypothetical protein
MVEGAAMAAVTGTAKLIASNRRINRDRIFVLTISRDFENSPEEVFWQPGNTKDARGAWGSDRRRLARTPAPRSNFLLAAIDGETQRSGMSRCALDVDG